MPAIDPRNIEVVDPSLAEVLRQKTTAERVSMIADANRTARALVAAGVRFAHPDWHEDQINAEVLRRMTSGSARSLEACG